MKHWVAARRSRGCVRAGKPVRIVFVTDGRASTRSVIITPEELVNIRCEEAKNACKVLGVDADHVNFLLDGEADKKIDEIRDLLCQRIGLFAPQRIFSPYATWTASRSQGQL